MTSVALLSADDARRLLAEFPAVGTERVEIARGAGRVLAADFVAPDDHPTLARAVMDGYALRAADSLGASDATPVSLKVVGSVPMGGVFVGDALGPGQAVQVSTGGVMPAGADAVLMIEYARPGQGGTLAAHRTASPGDNVMNVGDDVRRGELLLHAGRRLRPQDVAALAAFGHTELQVFRRPHVAVLSTGNEIVPPEAAPRPGQVRDMNQVALAAQIERAGGIATHAGIVHDEPDALRDAVKRLASDHDAVLLSGGSSVGARDLTADVLEKIGAHIVFHGINVRPGKPTILARLGHKPILGMPGVPVSAMIIFDAFVAPLLRRLGGEIVDDDRRWPARRRARLSRRVPSAAGREDYLRVRLSRAPDGSHVAEPILGGSAAVATIVRADGLVVVPAAADSLAEGQDVEVLLYD